MLIQYTASIFVDAGWRPATIVAKAQSITPKMAVVDEVVRIAGETPAYRQSLTGARRQSFNGRSIALREAGKTKRLSACTLLDEVAA